MVSRTPPSTHATTSGAKVAASSRASVAEVCGVISEGFTTATLPAASAAASGAIASCTG